MEIVHNALTVVQVLLFLALVFLMGYGACLLEQSERDLKQAKQQRQIAEISKAKQELEDRLAAIEKKYHVDANV